MVGRKQIGRRPALSHIQERQDLALEVARKLRTGKRRTERLGSRRLAAFRKAHGGDVYSMKADLSRQVSGFLGAGVVVDDVVRRGKVVAFTVCRA
ncbi:hypothetical protein E6P97_00670 [Patescibacteria group bacterium]|nr:MAG: hypothetical protein E6P97_00670 [Patescibacteria group bacterium]